MKKYIQKPRDQKLVADIQKELDNFRAKTLQQVKNDIYYDFEIIQLYEYIADELMHGNHNIVREDLPRKDVLDYFVEQYFEEGKHDISIKYMHKFVKKTVKQLLKIRSIYRFAWQGKNLKIV